MDILTGVWTAICLFLFLVLIGNYFVYQTLISAKTTSFRFSFVPVFLLSTAPVLALSVPIFAIYRKTVHWILSWTYGSQYWGLLEGRDSVFNLENENPIHVLFIIKYQTKNSQNFYNAVKDAMYKMLVLKGTTNPKIFGAIRTFLGYSYLLKDKITFNDCFRKLKALNYPISKDELLQLIGEYTTVPLHKNREALWDVFVGTQPVRWTEDAENDEVKCYPILLRVNHSLADGRHLLKGFVALFADNKDVKVGCAAHLYYSEELALANQLSWSVASIFKYVVNLGITLILYLRQFYAGLLTPSVGLVNSLLMVDDSHILHGPRPTHQKHLFLNVEKSPHYIQLMKRIKKKIPGSTFEDIYLTAIAASFKEYFQKNSAHIPEYIVLETPAVPRTLIRPERPKPGEVFCRNRLTFAVRRLPTNFGSENSNTPLINVLQSIKKEGALIKHSFEHMCNYFILTVVSHLVPAPILRPYLDIVHNCTAVISNMPGPNFMTVMDGCPIQHIGVWPAARGYTGIGFAIFTYDERLQLSLVVDKALVAKRSEIQSLLDGVYKYLDLLEQETIDIPDRSVL